MGQCCKNLWGDRQGDQSTKTAELVQRPRLGCLQSTQNDKEFTYFLGVFQLLSLGENLELPEYVDELDPNFSYAKFNEAYREYQKQIINLGKYIHQYRNQHSPLKQRITADLAKITALRNKTKIGGPGCLIKLELQDARWLKVKDIGVILHHPFSWEGKFQKWFKIESIESGPIFLEFAAPEIKGAVIKIIGKPGKAHIDIDVQDCLFKNQQLFCKVMKWKGASESEGLAVRLQLMSQDQQGQAQKFQEMMRLHDRLVREYGVNGQISMSVSEVQIADQLSRHRSSLDKKYNLSRNSNF